MPPRTFGPMCMFKITCPSQGAKPAKHQHARLAHRDLEGSHGRGRAAADRPDHSGDGDPRLLAIPQRADQRPGRQDHRTGDSRTPGERQIPADRTRPVFLGPTRLGLTRACQRHAPRFATVGRFFVGGVLVQGAFAWATRANVTRRGAKRLNSSQSPSAQAIRARDAAS